MSFYRVAGWLDAVQQDLRVAMRGLRRDPAFALTAVITLALGIGANTAIFVLANALLFKPIPAREPARLVALTAKEMDNPPGPIPSGVVEAIRRERVFAGVCGFLPLSVTVDIRGRIAPIQAHPVTGDCLDTLGVRPATGRLLTIDDERQGSPHVAVITYDTWTRDFGASPAVLTESVNIDGTQYAVVGVTERGFTGVTVGVPTRLFLPFGNFADGLTYPMLLVKSRAASTVSIEQLDRLVRQGGREYVSLARTLDTQRDAALVNERLLAVLSSLFAALGLALAAVGLHGLQAFLVTERTAEIGVRMALGARPSQICWLVLRSALALAASGAALGALGAFAGGRALAAVIPANHGSVWPSIGAAVSMMLVVALVASLVPTRRAISVDPVTALRHE